MLDAFDFFQVYVESRNMMKTCGECSVRSNVDFSNDVANGTGFSVIPRHGLLSILDFKYGRGIASQGSSCHTNVAALLLSNSSILHHEVHPQQRVNVLHRITIHRNNVNSTPLL